MQVRDLLKNSKTTSPYKIIGENCSDFLLHSREQCLLKSLPKNYKDFHRVKIRQKKTTKIFDKTLNEAFNNNYYRLSQRSLFINGESSFIEETHNNMESFYVFPINGFKFMYSKEVEHSSKNYKELFENVLIEFGYNKGQKLLTDVLRFTYNTTNLYEGIKSGAEIIIYNIPFYYAVRQSSIPYDDLLIAI